MPRSLLFSAILFIVAGIAFPLCKVLFSLSTAAPIWIGASSLTAGIGLLLGLNWGRSLASLLIFCGYVTSTVYLTSAGLPPKQGTTEVWGVYGRVFLGVALLTMVSGFLWSRPVSSYLNRLSDATTPKKT